VNLNILYFAWCKEKLGRAHEEILSPQSVQTVSDLMTWLRGQGGAYEEVFSNTGVIRVAVNYEHVDGAWRLNAGDEVAFFPPVTGG
jgi:molybdopterin synthase sulfur carrier subunit